MGRWCCPGHYWAANFCQRSGFGNHLRYRVTPNSSRELDTIKYLGFGVGEMKKKDVVFPLAPVYKKAGI